MSLSAEVDGEGQVGGACGGVVWGRKIVVDLKIQFRRLRHMSKNLFLVKYRDQNYFDDTSETLDQASLREDIYEKLKKYIEKKDILETKASDEKISIDYIKDEFVVKIVREVLVPECIRESEEMDKTIVDKNTESKLFLLGDLIDILRLMVVKRDKYLNNNNILLMIG